MQICYKFSNISLEDALLQDGRRPTGRGRYRAALRLLINPVSSFASSFIILFLTF